MRGVDKEAQREIPCWARFVSPMANTFRRLGEQYRTFQEDGCLQASPSDGQTSCASATIFPNTPQLHPVVLSASDKHNWRGDAFAAGSNLCHEGRAMYLNCQHSSPRWTSAGLLREEGTRGRPTRYVESHCQRLS